MGCTQSTAAATPTGAARTEPNTSSVTEKRPSLISFVPGTGKKKHALASNFIVEKKQNVHDNYTVIQRVGEGSIGSVFLVKKRWHSSNMDSTGTGDTAGLTEVDESETETGHDGEGTTTTTSQRRQERRQTYALKEIDKDKVDPESLEEMRNEINLMKKIDHPNVIKAYEVYEDKGGISIIMEYCSGGDLCSREPYTETQAQRIIVKIVQAVSYLHTRGIMHRDLKFENIMFETEAADAQPKIIDFGLATKYGKEEKFSDRVGTIVTMSPEAIRGDHNQQTDMWSVGVICFQLLSGKLPFWGDSMMSIAKQICTLDYNMDGPEWSTISKEAKSFVKWCLRIDPKLRYTPQKALQSAWLCDFVDLEKAKRLACPMTRTVIENSICTNSDLAINSSLRSSGTVEAADAGAAGNPTTKSDRCSGGGEFRRLALNSVAHKVSSQEIAELREIFHAIDVDHDGVLTIQEMRDGLGEQFGQTTIDDWFRHVDVDANGTVNYTEFLAATLEAQHEQDLLFHEDRVRDAFATFDRDDTGFITADNLREALGISKTDNNDYIENLIREADANLDGKICISEFRDILHKHHDHKVESHMEHDVSEKARERVFLSI